MVGEVLSQLEAAWPVDTWRDVTVLVGVSGGADSMALLGALVQIKSNTGGAGRIVAAHFHHGLRGVEADADQALVQEFCRTLDCDCVTERWTIFGDVKCANDNARRDDEASSRDARYDFLLRTALRRGARYVATAHTADDQAETVLHRIVRGTGLAGLAGIPFRRPLHPEVTLVRPLLSVRREQLTAWLNQKGWPYREDSSNRDRKYTRSRIRHGLIPHLQQEYNPRVVESLIRLGAAAREAAGLLATAADPWLQRCVEFAKEGVVIDCNVLAEADAPLVHEVFVAVWQRQNWPRQSMGFDQWEKLRLMTVFVEDAIHGGEQSSVKITLPGTVLAERKNGKLWLVRERPK